MKEQYAKLVQYQEALNNHSSDDPFEVAIRAQHMILAAVNELMEALDELPWKQWRTYDEAQVNDEWPERRELYLEELIDVQHFLFNAAIAAGVAAEEYTAKFDRKLQTNWDRLTRGHNRPLVAVTSKAHR